MENGKTLQFTERNGFNKTGLVLCFMQQEGDKGF